jgi:hypothetical protein
MQRALWDLVTPELRAVTVEARRPVIGGRFLYSHDPGSEEREIVAEFESYVLADFDSSVDVRFAAECLPPDNSRELLPGEEWVYLRREAGT